jgi:hypothetical protein
MEEGKLLEVLDGEHLLKEEPEFFSRDIALPMSGGGFS